MLQLFQCVFDHIANYVIISRLYEYLVVVLVLNPRIVSVRKGWMIFFGGSTKSINDKT